VYVEASTVTDKLPDVMTESEWRAFVGQFNLRAPTGLRNAALFTLMREAGLRTCEVIGLRSSDVRQDEVDWPAGDGAPTGGDQGGKERVAYLNEKADRLLRQWRKRRTALGLGRRRHVFTTLRGAPLDAGYIREVCARKGAAAGIAWRVHPHALRHSFATDLLEDTGDLALVQDALGHSSPDTTRVYAKVRNSRLARAMVGRRPEPEPDADAEDLAARIAKLAPEQREALKALLG
jgi:site-specific recombinase XerD